MKAVNLLPPEQRGSGKTVAAVTAPVAKGSAVGAYAVLGVLAFAVAAVAALVLAGNTIKDRKAELARTTQEAELVSSQASQLQAYADFKQLADQRITTVGDLAKARFDWPRAFGDVSRVLPADVHLRSLSGTVSTSTSGGGGNPLRGAVQAPALELDGSTTDQDGVARLMSRLHDVRGVTRVSLASSTENNQQTPVVAGTADADRLCPKGSPPDFEMVVFFERAQLGAGAVPNTSGSSTAPTSSPSGSTSTSAAPSATATPAPTTTSSTSATQGVSSK
jgi:Tfp pilus assembly protein PilN